MSALSLKEIKYILFAVYNVTMSASKLRKPYYVACIMAEMEKDIKKCEIFLRRKSQDAEIVVRTKYQYNNKLLKTKPRFLPLPKLIHWTLKIARLLKCHLL